MTQHTGNCVPLVYSPQVLWPSQNPQNRHPLRLIMFSRGSISYGVAKELAGIIQLLVSQSPHHIRNTQYFVQHIQQAKLEPGEVMASMMSRPISLLFLWTLTYNSPAKTTTGFNSRQQDKHVKSTHHPIAGVLPQKHILLLSR